MRDTQPIAAGARGLDAFGISMNRRIISLVILAATLSPFVFGQSSRQRGGGFSTRVTPAPVSKFDPEEHAKKMRFFEELSFQARDPYRVMDGKVEWVMAAGSGWSHFHGSVTGYTESNAMIVAGGFGAPMKTQSQRQPFAVQNYPYVVVEGRIRETDYMMAKVIGSINIPPGRRVPLLDYGKVWTQPPKIISESEKAATEVRTVEWLKSQSTNGAPSAQYSLGVRYLVGRGVETNEVLGLEWLRKASLGGSIEASNALVRLSRQL